MQSTVATGEATSLPPIPFLARRWLAALFVFYLVAAVLGAEPLLNWARAGQQDSWRNASEEALQRWATWVAPTGLSGAHGPLAKATAAWVAALAATHGHDPSLLAQAAHEVARDVPPPAAAGQPAEVAQPRANEPEPGATPPLAQEPLEAETEVAAGPATAGAKSVLLVGDSLMSVGLAPGILAELKGNEAFQVVRASRCATGLSRPDYFDWQGNIKKLIVKHKPDYVVVAMGGNDAQGFREAGDVLHMGSPAWDTAYQGRVESFAKSATASGAKLLWVGIPKVRSEPFWSNLKRLNTLAQAGLAKVGGTSYLDASTFLTTSDGKFATYLPDDKGREVKVRSGDGIHLTQPGGARVAKGVVEWLKQQK